MGRFGSRIAHAGSRKMSAISEQLYRNALEHLRPKFKIMRSEVAAAEKWMLGMNQSREVKMRSKGLSVSMHSVR